MAKRQTEWARKKRLELRRLLGMRCQHCGSKDYRKLEFDIIITFNEMKDKDGKSRHHRSMGWSWRMSFYRQQHRKGNVQLLCSKCNSRKGDS